jgi:tripartite-type tricarboxylate transporter receptor subunit TctC
MPRLQSVAQFLGAILLVLNFGTTAWAQAYPAKTIKLIVPFPPGGFTDATARVIAQHLGARLGQSVVIDNRPGAGTSIGAEMVARAQPDGYTLLYSGASTFTVNPVLLPNLPYDPLRSFSVVGIVCRTPMMVLAGPGVPANNVKELVALVNANPGKYAYGSFGSGTISHMAAEVFNKAVGIKLLHVPYKGSGPLMNDMVGGQVPLSFDTLVSAAPQLKAGKVKAIAVMTKERTALVPDVPTVAESGYADVDVVTWIGLVAPAGTPDPVLRKLREEVAAVVAMKEVQEAFRAIGVEPVRPDPENFVKVVQAELQRYARIAKEAQIRAD